MPAVVIDNPILHSHFEEPRAEMDEGEWSKLYGARSQPFDPPKSGKIAVKVINHFGDEVVKVYPVPKWRRERVLARHRSRGVSANRP